VDRTPPIATVAAGPTVQLPSSSSDSGIIVSINEPATTTCKTLPGLVASLGKPPYTARCGSPYISYALDNGPHTLFLQPTDRAGNIGGFLIYEFAIDAYHAKNCFKLKVKRSEKKAARKRCQASNVKAKAKWKKRPHFKPAA
jgi:hypothetical protein